MPIKYFDMFAGIGGFRSGLTNAGDLFLPVAWCEIDKYAQKAYRAMYETRGELFFEDARTINPDALPDIDLITAGFPCQPFSLASGKRLGFADPRGTLFFEIARIAEAKRPAYLCFENVPGLLAHDSGRTYAAILSTLSELGYHVAWQVLNSADFGLAQQRKRLYLICCLDERCTREVLPFTDCSAENLKELIPGPQGARVYSTEGVACTQTAGAGGWGTRTGLYFVDLNPDPKITECARCITARYDAGIGNRRGERSGVLNENTDAPRAILTPDRETVRQQGRRIKDPDEPMFCITATDKHGVLHHGRIRKLMPIEAWRLQGYTDEQFYKAQSVVPSDGQLYKMAGNAVSVPVIAAIGKRLLQFDEKYRIRERRSES